MDAFMFVGPAPGHEAASPADRWVADEFARAKREWRRHFRGDVVERLPENVSADDIATKHLVLFGTVEGRDSQLPGTILAEGFFDERWQP
jgi:hypothetical protein